MDKQWYVYTGGQQMGPYSWKQLWQKARSGAIAPADQVWNQSLPGWIRADQIAELFPSQAPPRPPGVAPSPTSSTFSAPVYSEIQAHKGSKGSLTAAIVIVLLLIGGAAAVYYFFFLRGGDPSSGSNDIVGCWYGMDEQGEGYFQFLDDGTVNLASPVDGYWSNTKYRLAEDNAQVFLEVYNNNYEDWEQVAELRLEGQNNLILTDVWDGTAISMQRISDQQFQEVIDQLEYYSD